MKYKNLIKDISKKVKGSEDFRNYWQDSISGKNIVVISKEECEKRVKHCRNKISIYNQAIELLKAVQMFNKLQKKKSGWADYFFGHITKHIEEGLQLEEAIIKAAEETKYEKACAERFVKGG